jgi:hypothetical protein
MPDDFWVSVWLLQTGPNRRYCLREAGAGGSNPLTPTTNLSSVFKDLRQKLSGKTYCRYRIGANLITIEFWSIESAADVSGAMSGAEQPTMTQTKIPGAATTLWCRARSSGTRVPMLPSSKIERPQGQASRPQEQPAKIAEGWLHAVPPAPGPNDVFAASSDQPIRAVRGDQRILKPSPVGHR